MPLVHTRGSTALILSRDRKGAVVRCYFDATPLRLSTRLQGLAGEIRSVVRTAAALICGDRPILAEWTRAHHFPLRYASLDNLIRRLLVLHPLLQHLDGIESAVTFCGSAVRHAGHHEHAHRIRCRLRAQLRRGLFEVGN